MNSDWAGTLRVSSCLSLNSSEPRLTTADPSSCQRKVSEGDLICLEPGPSPSTTISDW